MKWTADNDQLLFIKLIETHDVSIKSEKILEAWPKGHPDVPTARAIRERIWKIRNSLKSSTSGSTPSTPRKRKGLGSDTSTPKAPKTRKTAEDGNGSGNLLKRVREPVAATRAREESDTISDSDIYT